MAGRVKRLADSRPLGFVVVLAAAWYMVQGVVSTLVPGWEESRRAACGFVGAAALPLGLVWRCGWWRETGLRWQKPTPRWWLAVPLLAGCVVSSPAGLREMPPRLLDAVVLAVAAACSVEIASRGAAQFVLRRSGPARSAVGVAMLFGGGDVVAAASADMAIGDAVALGAAGAALGAGLGGVRWRVNTVWPLAAVHAVFVLVNLTSDPPPLGWRLAAGAGIAAYAAWVLHRVPTAQMRSRPTVRVACVDGAGRILLLQWLDPFDGSHVWELPGGGINEGESALTAARRELEEETGLDGNCVVDRHVAVARESFWNGRRYVGEEPWYLARVDDPPALSRHGMEPLEDEMITGHRWVEPSEAVQLPGRVQARDLAGTVARLTSLTGSADPRRSDGRFP